MKKVEILKQIKEMFISGNINEVVETPEVRALKELLKRKNKLVDPIIKGYNLANIVYENETPVLLLKYKNGSAKITVNIVEENNETNTKYTIRKLSDYKNTLSYYLYDSAKQVIEYESCVRDNKGISNSRGIIERDKNLSKHTQGVTKFYDYSLLNENIKIYDIERAPMCVVSNVIRNSKLDFTPTIEEYIETIDGNIITAETNVNTDDHYLFKKGNILYNVEEESDNKARIRK